jgi:iron complex outermembrane receptor protein
MKIRQKPLASAVTLALVGLSLQAHAQQQTPQTTETVTVTGIRASLEKSLETKRNADTVVEVVTAEDIGKMPDKNIADAVQRLPGVTISSQSGGSGGFDENDRVSLRGTNPSLTQTLINGHSVASGDWFVLDQVGLVGRSVSFSMLPSELVSQVIVRKTATADLVEGGIPGAIDIITRKPLQFTRQVTVEGSVGTVYADLPKKWDPQFTGSSTEERCRQRGRHGPGLLREAPRCAATGRRSWATAPSRPPARSPRAARPRQRRVSDAHRLGLLRAGARAQGRPAQRAGPADERFRDRRRRLLFEARGDQLQPELDDVGQPHHRRQSHTHRVYRAQRDAGRRDVAQRRHERCARAVRDRRPDLPAGRVLRDELFHRGWHVAPERTTSPCSDQVGQDQGKGETPKQDVFEGDVLNTGAAYSMHGIGSP